MDEGAVGADEIVAAVAVEVGDAGIGPDGGGLSGDEGGDDDGGGEGAIAVSMQEVALG